MPRGLGGTAFGAHSCPWSSVGEHHSTTPSHLAAAPWTGVRGVHCTVGTGSTAPAVSLGSMPPAGVQCKNRPSQPCSLWPPARPTSSVNSPEHSDYILVLESRMWTPVKCKPLMNLGFYRIKSKFLCRAFKELTNGPPLHYSNIPAPPALPPSQAQPPALAAMHPYARISDSQGELYGPLGPQHGPVSKSVWEIHGLHYTPSRKATMGTVCGRF